MKKHEFLSNLEAWNGISANSIKRVFFDVNLSKSHLGLKLEAERHKGVKVEHLLPGEYFAFINRDKSAIKLLTAYGSTIGYLRMPGRGQLNLLAVQYLPKFFSGGKLDYIGALGRVFKPGIIGQRRDTKERSVNA